MCLSNQKQKDQPKIPVGKFKWFFDMLMFTRNPEVRCPVPDRELLKIHINILFLRAHELIWCENEYRQCFYSSPEALKQVAL